MKILEQTPSRLRLQHAPWESWLTGAGSALGGFGFGIYVLFFWFASSTLTCNRPPGTQMSCQLTHRSLVGLTRQKIDMTVSGSNIVRVRRSRGTSSHIVLTTSVGMISIHHSEGQQAAVTQVNHFVSNPAQTFLFVVYRRGFQMLFFGSVVLVLIGAGIYLFNIPSVTCTFYHSLKKVVLERQRLGHQHLESYPLDEILSVELEDKVYKRKHSYRIFFRTQSGKVVALTQDYSSNLQHQNLILQTIKDFLATKA